MPIEEEGHYEQNILQKLRQLSLHFWNGNVMSQYKKKKKKK